MVHFIRWLIIVRPWIVSILTRTHTLLALLAPLIVGCEGDAARRDREHVKAMQTQVTEATRELVSADANARQGWVEAHQSFEKTRSSMVQQQSDIQAGLDRLEAERKTITAERVTDVLLSRSIETIGMIFACLVPLLLLGWLMQRVWQNDKASELEVFVEPPVSSFQVLRNSESLNDSDYLRTLEGRQRYLPHEDFGHPDLDA